MHRYIPTLNKTKVIVSNHLVMKKLMIALALVCFGTTTAMAQDTEVPTKKYSVATNSFWANWFISAGFAGNGSYTSQEDCCNVNPFSVDRGTLGFEVSVGKWFTPGIGLRTKFQGLWAKQVNTRTDHPSYQMMNIHEDVMFNLSNLLFGYNEKRVWNFIPYVGVGFVRNFDTPNNDYSFNGGLLNNFRVSKHVQIYLDIYTAWFEGTVDAAENDIWRNYKKHSSRYWDKLVGASIGVTYNLGKCTWEKTPDVDALMAMNKEQMDALQRSLEEQQAENARLRELLAQKPKAPEPIVEYKTEIITTTASVFFDINSAEVASRKDLVNVKELAEVAKANNSKVLVCGYADSKTGSAEYNQELSQKRAETVAEELVSMGVDRDNIVTEAKGGVDELEPYPYNRRATVKIQ